jgi:hypothetical protein
MPRPGPLKVAILVAYFEDTRNPMFIIESGEELKYLHEHIKDERNNPYRSSVLINRDILRKFLR